MVSTIQAKDATGATLQLAVVDGGATGLVPVHVEQPEQRAAMIAILNGIVTAVQATTSATQPVSLATLPLASGAATDTKVEAVRALLAAPLQVTGPLTSAQLTTAALATSAAQTTGNTSLTAIQTALAGTVKVDTVVQATSTNRSGTITAGGTAQQLMASNASRRGFVIQNNSNSALFVNGIGAATSDGLSLTIAAGALYESSVQHTGTGAVSILGATTGQVFYAREF